MRDAVERVLEPFAQARTGEALHLSLHELLSRTGGGVVAGGPRRVTNMPWTWKVRTTVDETEVVTLHNRGPDRPAEVVVRVRIGFEGRPRHLWRMFAWLERAAAGGRRRHHRLWLGLSDAGDGWTLTRVDLDGEGDYHLATPAVAEPAADPALGDQALQEVVDEDVIAAGEPLPFDLETGAARQLLDLSLLDARFAPPVLEAAVRSLMREWQRAAVTRRSEALEALCAPLVAEYAMAADLPVRLCELEVVALDREPVPAVFLAVEALVQVDRELRRKRLWWKLELDDDLPQHWRLASAYARGELRGRG